MTTRVRVLTCARCGFATDDTWHYRNCVPTSQWPRELRERKAEAMHQQGPACDCGEPVNAHPIWRPEGWHFASTLAVVEREPERVKPQGLAEYRRLHPEANPLTAETVQIKEVRVEKDGRTREWERPEGIREARNRAEPCPRCRRPMLDRAMHITCKAVDGSPPPERPAGGLQRDDIPLRERRGPVVHTTADVRQGAGWFESMAIANEEPEPDEDELHDFVGETDSASEYDGDALRERLIAEQEAEHVRIVTVAPITAADYANPLACPTCGRVSASKAGSSAHQRSHKAVSA